MTTKLPKGVSKNGNRFKAVARRSGKVYYLGSYDTPAEAGARYAKFNEINPMPPVKSIRWDGGAV